MLSLQELFECIIHPKLFINESQKTKLEIRNYIGRPFYHLRRLLYYYKSLLSLRSKLYSYTLRKIFAVRVFYVPRLCFDFAVQNAIFRKISGKVEGKVRFVKLLLNFLAAVAETLYVDR